MRLPERDVTDPADAENRHQLGPLALQVGDLVGVGQVAFRRRGLQRQRIIGLHLVVVGIALRHALHRGIVGCQSGTHGDLVMVAEIGAQRLDPVALTLRLRPGHPRFFQRVPSRLRVGPRRRGCQGVAEVVHRHTPVCHRAGGILLQNPLELPAGDQEPV